MIHQDIGRLATVQETISRYEVAETHLFDDDAGEEEALCQVGVSVNYIRSAKCYLEDRLHGARVGIVCQGCKERAIPFAVNVDLDLEAEGLLDEAEEYRQLAEKLLRETSNWMAGPFVHMWPSFAFLSLCREHQMIGRGQQKPR